jgi:hypothetical protein
VISLSPEAETQLDGLLTHFERLNRIAAAENLLAVLERASVRILRAGSAGLPAPRPYPALARHGFRWMKEGRHWLAFLNHGSPIIVGFFMSPPIFRTACSAGLNRPMCPRIVTGQLPG